MTPSISVRRPLILVIDDVASSRRVIGFSLGGLDAECIFAEDGIEGLECVALRKPDLVILDLALPHLTGDHVLRALRADEETSSIPVLVVTAHGQSAMAKSILAMGADCFMEKPFLPAELCSAAEDLLSRAAG